MRLNFREGGSRQYNWCVFILYYYNFLSYCPLSFSSISRWSFHIHVRSFESTGALKCFPWRHMISSSDVLVSPHREDIPKCRKEESRGFFLSKKCVFISLNLFRSVISLLRKDFIFWMIWYVLSALKAASVKGFKSLRVVEKLPESPAMCLRSSQQFWRRVFPSWGSSDSSSYLGFCKLVCTSDELHSRHSSFDTVRAVQVCTAQLKLVKRS